MENRPAQRLLIGSLLLLEMLLFGCSASRGQRNSPTTIEGGIALTPPEHYTPYYSTQKARALGESYSENLDRLLERITQSPIGKMQFANAIVSLSLGFFTHSASRPPDERYLEALLAMPDILEEEEDVNVTVSRLFAQYGREILAVLASDTTIADDPKVAGYGINFSWRNMLKTPSGPRMSMREAVIYVPKKKSERFLNRQIEHDELLGTSAIFVRQGEKAAQQVRYSPPPSPPSASRDQAPLDMPQLAPVPETSLQESVTDGDQPNLAPAPTTLSPLQEQQEQNLLGEKSPSMRRPSAPSSQQHPSPERHPFDPPSDAQNSSVKPPSLQPAQEESYLVQFTFVELLEAQRWVATLKEGGYVTSLNFVKKEDHPIHLRVGHFASLTEATRFADDIKAQGLPGLVLKGLR